MAKTEGLDPSVKLVRDRLADNQESHSRLVRRFDAAYEAWSGYLDAQSEAADWTSKQSPKYVLSLVEAVIANQIDPQFAFVVNPAPRLADDQYLETLRVGAKAHEYLLRDFVRCDRFEQKQDEYALTNAICGLAVGKVSWAFSSGMRHAQRMFEEDVIGDDGEPVTVGRDIYGRPRPATMQIRRTVEEPYTERDEPTFENRDPRDFFFPESAKSASSSPWLADRTWVPLSDLKEMECQVANGAEHEGECKGGIYHNVDEIPVKAKEAPTETDPSREQKIHNEDRTKDLVEVIEMWDRTTRSVISIANQMILLAKRPWPAGYRRYPYIVLTTTPDMFRIPGISLVERAATLQTLLWSLMNQRYDNLKLINNAVALIREDMVPDWEENELAPGETWLVENGPVEEAVKMWSPDPQSVTVSMPAEAQIRADMQALTNGGILSGAASTTLDQTTATGVSIVTSLAQKVVGKQKRRIELSQQEVGCMWLELAQVYVTEDRLVRTVGPDGAVAFEPVRAMDLQGDYAVEITASTDSSMRQERRAEAQALLQMALQAAPIMAAIQTPLNMVEFVNYLLDSFDLHDKQRFFSGQPPALGAGAAPGGGPGAPGGGGAGPGGETVGVTAPQSIDPATSPSNQVSMSPATFMQRMGARLGLGRK